MKWIVWIVAGLVALVVLLGALQFVASERVEVVEIHAKDASGEVVTTRLWVVDYEGEMYLRVGSGGSGWFSRIQANPDIEVTRGAETGAYTAIAKPELRGEINDLMQQKYTWGDTLIGFMVGARDHSIPIVLQPAG